MFDRKSTALASFFALALVGLSGHLASAAPEPAKPLMANVYADSTSPSGSLSMTPVQAGQIAPKNESAWGSTPASHPLSACDLRCRTGFFGYR
jgi:hypothetical protein